MPKRTIFFDDNQDTTLGGRVFQAREAAGMTVAQVINRLGVRKATYMAWEADRSEPRANKLVALAGILNVSPTFLLSGLGEATKQPPKHQQIIEELRLDIEQLDQNLYYVSCCYESEQMTPKEPSKQVQEESKEGQSKYLSDDNSNTESSKSNI